MAEEFADQLNEMDLIILYNLDYHIIAGGDGNEVASWSWIHTATLNSASFDVNVR